MRIPSTALVCAFLIVCTCACPPASNETTPPTAGTAPPVEPPSPPSPPEPAGADRTAAVPSDHALYGRVEGTSFQNACQTDTQCFVGGC